MSKKETMVLFVAGIIFAIVLAGVLLLKLIDTAQAIQITISFVLVLVTTIYVKRTTDIAQATKGQADASVEMAKHVRKQTETLRETLSMTVRPFVSIEVLNVSRGHSYPFEPPDGLYVELQNTGKGPARNLVLTCEAQEKKVEYSRIELPSLNVGDKRQFSISKTTAISGDGVRVAYVILEAQYNDEFEKAGYTTLQIDRDENEWKPGEVKSGTSWGLFGPPGDSPFWHGSNLFGGEQ
jgi:hypothetical protein